MEALADLTGAIDDAIVDKLIEALDEQDTYWPGDGDEPFYSEEYRYVPNDYSFNTHSLLWQTFRSTLLYDQRFFNAKARDRVAQIFENIHRQRDAQGNAAVYMVHPGEPGATIYRARMADDPEIRRAVYAGPAKALGTPPHDCRRPGRLNPSGVAAFYGSVDVPTCVAELRPPVGSLVCSAQFKLLRPICVLDTTRFEAPGKVHDPFSRHAVALTAQWRFMQEIAKPVRPSDEHREYVPTQAVAEFLASQLDFNLDGKKRRIDAIIYRSAQAGGEGKNIVLLGQAAQVRDGHPIAGEDYMDFDFYDPTEASWTFAPYEPPPCLAVSPDSLTVHRVSGARFEVAEYEGLDSWPGPLMPLGEDDRF